MTLQREIPPHAARKLAELAPAAVRLVADAVAAGRPADVTLANHFRAHRELGSRDRRFLSDLVFSFFRWRGWTRNLDMNSALALSHRLDAIEIHPAIAILAARSDLQPLGSLSLEEKAAAVAGVAPEDLVPAWVREVLHEPDNHLRKCIEAFQKRPPTWLRIARRHVEDVLRELQSKAIPYDTHPAMSETVSVTGSPVISSPHVEIQDLASQITGLICDPKSDESWWDVCAGSGGKSLHLADLMKNQGFIRATDVRESALTELRRRAKRAGVTIITAHGTGRPAREDFDGVLVDAPCSGIGTWSRNPDARWRTSEQVVTEKAAVQGELLRQAARHVKPGGMLVYSVCTVTTAETAEVVRRFLAENSEFRLAPAPHPLTSSPTPGTFWIWPWDGPGDGMFVARVVRPV